ncbi:MAG: PA2779 family protein [Deltaproteobacteria bacterium]|nr:PA2779 family protein [Deltaproteobacteria bacterium]
MKKLRLPKFAFVFAIYFLFFSSSPAISGLVASYFSSDQYINPDDIDKIKNVLEMKIVAEKLKAYGLSPEEVKAKLSEMSPEQIHMLAQASNNLLAGGDGIGFVIGVLVIVLLVLVILKLLNKTIVIK